MFYSHSVATACVVIAALLPIVVHAQESSPPLSKWSIALSGGPALPVGVFAAKNERVILVHDSCPDGNCPQGLDKSEAGLALSGYYLTVGGQYRIRGPWIATGTLSSSRFTYDVGYALRLYETLNVLPQRRELTHEPSRFTSLTIGLTYEARLGSRWMASAGLDAGPATVGYPQYNVRRFRSPFPDGSPDVQDWTYINDAPDNLLGAVGSVNANLSYHFGSILIGVEASYRRGRFEYEMQRQPGTFRPNPSFEDHIAFETVQYGLKIGYNLPRRGDAKSQD